MKPVIKLIVFGTIPLLLFACSPGPGNDGNNGSDCRGEACQDTQGFLPPSQTMKTPTYTHPG